MTGCPGKEVIRTGNPLVSQHNGQSRASCDEKCKSDKNCTAWQYYTHEYNTPQYRQQCNLYEKFQLVDTAVAGLIAGPCNTTGR